MYAPTAHAAPGTGLVCLADPTSAPAPPSNPCPAPPGPTLSGPLTSPNTQITIGVFVNGSDAINGFDITLLTNHTILSPVRIDLTGTVLIGTPVIAVECLSRVGNCFSTDTLDTVHLFAFVSSLTSSPTTGLLFTVTYNITGVTPTGGIPIGFQTRCSNTSVAGGVCVTMPNGTPTPDPELSQTAAFDNHAASTNVPYVTMTMTPNRIGPVLPSSRTYKTTITTSNTWPPRLAANSVTFSFLANSSFQGVFTPTSCAGLGASATCSVNLTTSSLTPEGVYQIIVLTHYASNDLGTTNLQTDTLAATYAVQFIVFGYRVSLSPSVVQAAPGTSVSSIATITSINGFSGSGNITIAFTPTGLSVTVTPATFVLPSGGSVTENLSMHQTAATPTAQSFLMFTRALMGNQTRRSNIITVKFNGFSLLPASSSISFNSGSSLNDTLLIQSLPMSTSLGYSGAVTLANSTNPSSGLTVNCNASPNPVILNAGGSTPINCKFTSLVANNYAVTFTGTGGNPPGSISNSTTVAVTVLTQTTTSVSCSPTSVVVGASTTCTATVTSTSGGLTTPTGAVTFSSTGSGTFSPAVNCSLSGAGASATCSAFYTPAVVGTGTHSMGASYGGDPNHSASSAATPFQLAVLPFDFSLNNTGLLDGGVTIVQGFGASNTIIVTLTGGTTQSVNLACTSGLPAGASCGFNPSSVFPTSTSGMILSASPSTPTGSFLVTVTGIGGGLSHTTAFTLTVVLPQTIGGVELPVDKLRVLAPYLGLATVLAAVLVATVMRARHAKPRVSDGKLHSSRGLDPAFAWGQTPPFS